MGKPVDTNYNDLQQKVDANGKRVVDNTETDAQGVSTNTKRPARGIDWTSILERNGLESPGYKETITKMKADGRLRNSLE